ncbi:hypothetical protein BAE44_0023904 [Dichanthelium oligosanthes]|uniref:Uncharacterized protein n=1 Tax=Dichanthelium oligosanthes TaxID=888268 RepID=A0A1E5UQD6_9POAL|nr:hypothetical protein BAE44_0023904 [Dichanthelium oligosanthes]
MPHPPTLPTPAEPLTSLTLSLPGGGGGAVPETPAPHGAAAASMDGAAKMRTKLEQDWPWLLTVMWQMIGEEAQRHLQGLILPCSLVAPPARRSSAGAADGSAAANSQD